MSALEQAIPYFPARIRQALRRIPADTASQVEEVRLRIQRPVMLVLADRDAFLGDHGIVRSAQAGINWSAEDANSFIEAVSQASLYAVEQQVKQGFITLPGGHRVGLVGQVVPEGGGIRTIRHFSSFNVRLARQVFGAADAALPHLVQGGRLYHTLIASAPGCGKTTLLRDLIRQVSNGVGRLGLPGMRVAVADERSELAACFRGLPQLDVGMRTDVLDGCPKSLGIGLLLRAMGPQVIATDEIGADADGRALEEALNSGVTLVATAHGASIVELRRRPVLARLLDQGAFERVLLLSRRQGPGTLEDIIQLTRKEIGDQPKRAWVVGESCG
ncbi:MAG TPA: stage III sporulation protein AA [Firmicutes bacterium]|jgi:stage III sporulation protein AA|nr:stage III sporulation protein AA [Bacillota bacterium]